MSKTKYIVIYDGDCGFCQSTVNVIKKSDWLNKFTFVPFQQEDWVLKKYSELTKEMCEKEIYLVIDKETNKKYYGGYDAFKRMTLFLPVTLLISRFFFLPGVTNLGRIIYRLIAENRHKIKIGELTCKIDKKK